MMQGKNQVLRDRALGFSDKFSSHSSADEFPSIVLVKVFKFTKYFLLWQYIYFFQPKYSYCMILHCYIVDSNLDQTKSCQNPQPFNADLRESS